MTIKAPDHALGILVHDVARALRRRFEQETRAQDLGLTRAQCSVLVHLARQEGSTQAALAQRMDIEPITLARLLNKLEELGMVERRRDPKDRRAHRLALTGKAGEALERIYALSAVVYQEAQIGLAPPDQEQLIRLLLHIKSNLAGSCQEVPDITAQLKRRHHG
jgi:DNA-binding MarR family transcriptional regulator